MKLHEAETQLRVLQLHGPLRTLAEGVDIGKLPLSRMEQLQRLLRHDLERLDLVCFPPFRTQEAVNAPLPPFPLSSEYQSKTRGSVYAMQRVSTLRPHPPMSALHLVRAVCRKSWKGRSLSLLQ